MGKFKGYRLASTAGRFPESLIAWESMQIQPEQVAELSAYENSNNDLIRKTANHKRFKMSFQTLNGLTDTEVKEIHDWIDAAVTNEQEQRLTIIAWNDRKHAYYSYDCYIPNLTYQERGHYKVGDESVIEYKPITYTFISYTEGHEVSG